MKFLHTADWQLGMTRHFLDEDAQPRYTAARIDAIREIAALAQRENCEFVVVCGDVFETNIVAPGVVSRALEAMRSIRLPVYLLPGNHDPLEASSIYTRASFKAACPENVTVLLTPGAHQVSPGVEILAAPWFSKKPLEDLAAAAISQLQPDGTLRVLVAHGGTDLLDPDQTNPALIRVAKLEEALSQGSLRYVALGDKHSATKVGDTGRIWYSGTQEVTSSREPNPGKVLLVDLDSSTTTPKVSQHQIGTWAFLDLAFELNNSFDLTDLAAELDALENKDRTVLRLSLKGTLSLKDKAELDLLLESNSLRFASVHLWERHTDLQVYVDGQELGDLGVNGFAAEAVAELMATSAGTGDDAATAQDALSLLYRLAGGSK
ncbi:DNA repair exonuclease [Renibacterium salmoninarum ATCC 33209]|uniref:Nuclease SbcCD subunit D n=1 Tax=Renibacterium salmoninarum (strain ATCC 33209 / DSM 20767 / JCM 11484 / NBRC 15589 / NCIMB 2235) TaxID=288705 RepID=A9WNL2_RENSM|nr:exonuclease SbcCD subunit D [Renibacterium salmoninarum]ABY23230.1 DNA repair exonuclease [Renibacterium salmoninarum ATCC 33209]